MVIENAGWLYFCPWYGDHLMSSQYNDAAQLKKMYTSDYCITLDELPKDLYGNAEPGTTVTTDATTDTTAETTTETETTAKKHRNDCRIFCNRNQCRHHRYNGKRNHSYHKGCSGSCYIVR